MKAYDEIENMLIIGGTFGYLMGSKGGLTPLPNKYQSKEVRHAYVA